MRVQRRLSPAALGGGGVWRASLAGLLVALIATSAAAQSAIYVMREDGSAARKVADAPGFKSVGHARWSHDGKRLAFHGWDGPGGSRQVFTVDVEGGRPAVPGPPGQLPDWSNDDKQLAFQTPPADGIEGGIWVENVAGQGRTQFGVGSSPRWSRDGGRLAFIASDNELLVRDLADDAESSLTQQPWSGVRPGFDWSPDGGQIAFVARRDDGVLGLWLTDTKNPAPRLRLAGNMMGQVGWSPDGKKLAISLGNQIQLLEVDGNGPARPIPNQTGASRDPAWSPDGKWISFSSNRAQ